MHEPVARMKDWWGNPKQKKPLTPGPHEKNVARLMNFTTVARMNPKPVARMKKPVARMKNFKPVARMSPKPVDRKRHPWHAWRKDDETLNKRNRKPLARMRNPWP